MYRIFLVTVFFILFISNLSVSNIYAGKDADHNTMAYSLVKDKKYNEAIEFLLGLSDEKYTYFTYYVLGEAYRNKDEYKKSLSYYKRSISMFDVSVVKKDKAIIHSALAYVYSKLGEYDLAILDYLKSLTYLPDNYIILSNLGKAYLRLEDHKNAIEYFNKSLSVNPSYTMALKGLARVYFELGSFKKAIFFYNKLRELAPHLSDGYFGLAYTLEQLGNEKLSYRAFAKAHFIDHNYSKSVSYIKKLSYRDNKEDYLLLISAYIYLKDYKTALEESNKAISIYGDEEEFILTKVQVSFIKKEYKRSIEEALSAIKAFPNSYKLFALLGRSYSELADNDNAILYYNKALLLKQDDVNTRERLAHIYRQMGKQDLEFFHQGVVYFFLGDYFQSSKVLEWVNVDTFTAKASLTYYKGMVLWASGKKEAGINDFLTSIKEDDSLYLPYLALARGYDELGKRDKSTKLLERYIKKYPQSYHTGKVKELLKSFSGERKIN